MEEEVSEEVGGESNVEKIRRGEGCKVVDSHEGVKQDFEIDSEFNRQKREYCNNEHGR